MKNPRFSVAVVIALGVSALVAVSAQQPVFRSETNYIEVVASVTNKAGEFVTGLTAADFEIREQGRPETIDTFSFVELPVGAATTSRPTSPVRFSPDVPVDQREADGRLYLLYVNGTNAGASPLVRKLATDFISEHLQPGDRAAIWDSQFPMRPITFTDDKTTLLADVQAYTGASVGVYGGLPFAFRCSNGSWSSLPVGQREQCQSALAQPHQELTKAIKWYNGIQGRRKSIILFAGGWLGQSDPVTHSDITLYAVDVRGLVAPDAATLSTNGQSGAAAADAVGQRLSQINESANGLWSLAHRTGGFAIINHNDFEPGFKKIVEANSRYYVLGYASSYKRQDRVYRELDVKVKQSGLKVHARRGYFPIK
ncbi:MAG: VWA domain-containing protein [Acidobacteria bacterium]|jgi:VWFA-related protein|nr:VWA domain-containing protein [Acidobacteriota bacterium]